MKKIILSLLVSFILALVNCASLTSGDPVYLAALSGNDASLTKELLLTADLNVTNSDGNTALMWAVYNQNELIVKKLVEYGAQVGYKDRYGNTTLSIAKNYLTTPVIMETLRAGYKNQLACPTFSQSIRGLLGLRQCVSFNGKSPSDDELDKYSKKSDGTITKISPVTILKLLSQKKMESNDELLRRKNMSERDRIAEYRKVSTTYEIEGSSENNAIARDPFDVCKFTGDLKLEEIKYLKETRSDFEKKYTSLLLKEDMDSKEWLTANTTQFILPSIEDRHKFVELKKKLAEYTNGIILDFERFFAYNDLANEKTIEKDYQKMASMLAQIVIYKVNNYKKKKENLSGCNFEPFTANDSLLEKIKSDAQKYLETLSKRVTNDKNAPLNAIRIKMMRGDIVESECRAILNDSPKKYESHRDLAQALTWCYASILDASAAEPFFKRINELSDPVALREAESIKKERAEGKPITMPSMGKAEQKTDSLPGPQSQKYKLAVLTFIDQTQTRKGESVRYSLTDMLTSELYDTHRFALVDRDDLIQIERNRNKSKKPTQENRSSKENHQSKEADVVNEDKPVNELESPLPHEPMTKSYKATDMGPYNISTDYALRRTEIERENMRGKDIGIDGYLLGYITSIDLQKQSMELDFRIVYPVNANKELNVNPEDGDTDRYIQSLRNLVVYGGNWKVKIRYDEKREMINIARNDIQNLAIGIKQAFADTETINKSLVEAYEYIPEDDEFSAVDTNTSSKKTVANEIKNKEKVKPSLKVMKIEGDKIIINAGAFHKVRSGLIGYVIDTADFGTYRYLARFVVEQVFEKSARCILLEGVGNLSKEGQSVIIK